MKILLTSAGFLNPKIAEEFLSLVSDNDVNILMISYAQNDEEQFYIDESKKELLNLGFENIEIADLNDNIDVDNLGNFSVIYVCGGNTYSILAKMKELGLDKFIIDQVNSGSVYVGVSAGSIIAGKNIEIAGWGSEGDSNDVELKDLSGLGFIDIAVFPHFRNELSNEVEEFKNKVNYPVKILTDEQAILLKDDEVIFINQ